MFDVNVAAKDFEKDGAVEFNLVNKARRALEVPSALMLRGGSTLELYALEMLREEVLRARFMDLTKVVLLLSVLPLLLP